MNIASKNMIEKKLPYLRRLEFLESTGTQYINTRYKASTARSRLKIRIMLNDNNQAAALFGSRNSDSGDDSSCNVFAINSNMRFDWCRFASSSHAFVVGEIYDIEITRGYLKINGVELSGSNMTDVTQQNDFAIFAMYQQSGILYSPKAKVRVYQAEMTEDGLPVFNLIPVMSLDNEPCFYDKVSGKLFYNQGTGEFTWGELED